MSSLFEIPEMAAQRWVVVDDTDPVINYIGDSWFKQQSIDSNDNTGSLGPAYQGTLHGTNISASLSFTFNGTQVKVLGFNDIRNNSNVLDPTWNCFVDNAAIGRTTPYAGKENNWVLCQYDNLAQGSHVLTVNATVLAEGQTFWFDQIQYVPPLYEALDNATVLIDNSDSALLFGPGWGPLGDSVNGTIVPNSFVTLQFGGTSLSWYGTIPKDFPSGTARGFYEVDGGDRINFTVEGTPPGTNTTHYNQQFFETSEYPEGLHELVVVYQGNWTTTPLTLDYLLIKNPYSAFQVSPQVEMLSALSDGHDSTNSMDRHRMEQIIGLTIGILVLVSIAACAFVYYHRRRRSVKTTKSAHFDLLDGYMVEPFWLPPLNLQGRKTTNEKKINRYVEGGAPTPIRSISEQDGTAQQSNIQSRQPLQPPVVFGEVGVHSQHHEFANNGSIVEMPPVYSMS